jgi:hypothetical protein
MLTYDEYCQARARLIELMQSGQLPVLEASMYMMCLTASWAAQQELLCTPA